MKEVHLFYAPDIEQTQELPAEEAVHAIRVLRLKEGEELLITDGKGTFYDAELSLASQKHCKITKLLLGFNNKNGEIKVDFLTLNRTNGY